MNWYKQAQYEDDSYYEGEDPYDDLSSGGLTFFSDCVGWPEELIDSLHALIDEGEDITLEQLQEVTDWKSLGGLIYPFEGDPHRVDWHVTSHRLPNWPIYWFCHSAIEYVFPANGAIELLQRATELAYNNDEEFNPNKYTYDFVKSLLN